MRTAIRTPAVIAGMIIPMLMPNNPRPTRVGQIAVLKALTTSTADPVAANAKPVEIRARNHFDSSPAGNLPLSSGDRGGSHNLVIGAANRFTQAAFGSLIVGTANTIKGYGASFSGGGNTASNYGASVSGGFSNTASGPFASVSGGSFNTAFQYVTFQGGLGASVSGGSGNTAAGRNTVVIGGQNVTDNKDNSIAPKPPFP